MSLISVGIGEFEVSRASTDTIKTYALGSCVAVIAYDKANRIGGMIHVALPDSTINSKKAETQPGYFVDTGLILFIGKLDKIGINWDTGWIKIVGGSSIMDKTRHFDIGRRNVLAVKKWLWKRKLGITGEDVGGEISRTVAVKMSSGAVSVTSGQKSWEL
jgi:chemotaxis protein CheD